jgi:hypothetical protein
MSLDCPLRKGLKSFGVMERRHSFGESGFVSRLEIALRLGLVTEVWGIVWVACPSAVSAPVMDRNRTNVAGIEYDDDDLST